MCPNYPRALHFSYGRARPLSGPSYVATSILVQRHIIHIAFSFDVIYDFRLFLLACRSGFCYFTTKKHLILTLTTTIKYGFLSTFTATRMQLQYLHTGRKYSSRKVNGFSVDTRSMFDILYSITYFTIFTILNHSWIFVFLPQRVK